MLGDALRLNELLSALPATAQLREAEATDLDEEFSIVPPRISGRQERFIPVAFRARVLAVFGRDSGSFFRHIVSASVL